MNTRSSKGKGKWNMLSAEFSSINCWNRIESSKKIGLQGPDGGEGKVWSRRGGEGVESEGGGKVWSRRGRSEGSELEGENKRGGGVRVIGGGGARVKGGARVIGGWEGDGGVHWQCGKKTFLPSKMFLPHCQRTPHRPHRSV